MEPTESLWQQCKDEVQMLRMASREKSFYDPAVRAVRLQLRTAYEAFLLQDYNGAQVHPLATKSLHSQAIYYHILIKRWALLLYTRLLRSAFWAQGHRFCLFALLL